MSLTCLIVPVKEDVVPVLLPLLIDSLFPRSWMGQESKAPLSQYGRPFLVAFVKMRANVILSVPVETQFSPRIFDFLLISLVLLFFTVILTMKLNFF